MKRFLLFLLSLFMVSCLAVSAQGLKPGDRPDTAGDAQEDTSSGTAGNSEQIQCRFSQPVATDAGEYIEYQTTLYAQNVQDFYGYQIAADDKSENMDIKDLAGGMATPLVYKQGTANFATLNTESNSDGQTETALCKITCRLPAAQAGTGGTLKVNSLQLITSLAQEKTVDLGPLSLELPAADTGGNVWLIFSAALLILLAAGVYLYRRRFKRKIRMQENQVRSQD